MNLEEKINTDIKTAMLAKEQARLEALRGIKAALILLKTSGEAVSEESEMKALQKMVKQRKEAADIYNAQNRKDLADVELFQASIIEAYMPKQMSEGEVRAEIQKIIQTVGASSPADMGKVMGAASKQLGGKADNKLVATLVKELLAK
jgi:uncharacterized protein